MSKYEPMNNAGKKIKDEDTPQRDRSRSPKAKKDSKQRRKVDENVT